MNLLVLGATSAIARATAAAFARRGHDLYLAARDTEELDRIASDLRLRHGVRVDTGRFDAEDTESHPEFVARVCATLGEPDGVLLAFGYLGEPPAAREFAEARRIIERNFTGAVSILSLLAERLEARRHGFIIGIASVAGDRGRQSNYVYGAAKGALALFLQGLRNRLHPAGVRVITVKPGFVDTAMTFGLPGLFLVASPRAIGERIAAAPGRRADIVYLPGFWRWIMLVIRLIPEALFKRLKL